jgi:hypothetical protein
VHFRLVDATEDRQGNAKVDEGDDRVFILAGGTDDSIRPFLSVENGEQGGELAVFFEYRPATVDRLARRCSRWARPNRRRNGT